MNSKKNNCRGNYMKKYGNHKNWATFMLPLNLYLISIGIKQAKKLRIRGFNKCLLKCPPKCPPIFNFEKIMRFSLWKLGFFFFSQNKGENLLLYTVNFVYKSVSNFVYISRGQIKENGRSTWRSARTWQKQTY